MIKKNNIRKENKENILKNNYSRKISKVVLLMILICSAIIISNSNYSSAQVFNLFNDTYNELYLPFQNSTQNYSFYVTLPNSNIDSASMFIDGQSLNDSFNGVTRKPADIVVITDFSGSMKKSVNSDAQGNLGSTCANAYLNSAIRKTFVAQCLDSDFVTTILSNSSNNRIWPVMMHKDTTVYYDNPKNSTAIINYVNSFPNGDGKTCISCAINKAYDILKQYNDSSRAKFILLMTDGTPTHCANGGCYSNSSIYGQLQCNGYCDTTGSCTSSSSVDAIGCQLSDLRCEPAELDTIYAAQRAKNDLNVTFFTVAFGLVESCQRSANLLNQIAALNNGTYYHSSSSAELKGIYDNISAQILSRSDKSYPSPVIEDYVSSTPSWFVNSYLYNKSYWNQSDCIGANCVDLRLLLQSSLDLCNTPMCRVNFSLRSNSSGTVILSDLYIDTSPRGTINCSIPTKKYLLSPNEKLLVNIYDIFTFNGSIGNVSTVVFSNSSLLNSSSKLPNGLEFIPNSLFDSETVYVNIRTIRGVVSQNCPIIFSTNTSQFGSITCNANTPTYPLFGNENRDISLNKIFTFNGDSGAISDILEKEENGVLITPNFPSAINFLENNLTSIQTSKIKIRTSIGVKSPLCPIKFASINSKCGTPTCQQYIADKNFDGLKNECIDGQISVYNLNNIIKLHNIYENLKYINYNVTDFISLDTNPNNFIISPSSGTRFTYFLINGSNLQNYDSRVGIINVQLDSGRTTTFCPLITRLDFYNGVYPYDITSDLLVTSSRSVSGYYDFNGDFISNGPYIYTVKIWLRK